MIESNPSNLKKDEGFDFIYVQNQNQNKKIFKIVCQNFASFHQKNNLSQNLSMLTLFGGSGVGKSRFSFEIPSIVINGIKNVDKKECKKCVETELDLGIDKIFEELQNFFDKAIKLEIFTKESNGDQYQPEREKLSFHILSQLLLLIKNKEIDNDRVCTKLSDIKISLRELKDEIDDIDFILELISNFHDKKPMVVFWRVDEIQKLGTGTGFLKKDSSIYLYTKYMMDVSKIAYKYNIFIIPIVSGTSLIDIHKLLPESSYSFEKINITVGFDLAYKLIKSCDDISQDSIINHPQFPFFLSLVPINRLVSIIHFSKKFNKKRIENKSKNYF
jgi:hypothetical protein